MKLLPFDYAIRNLARSPKRLVLVAGGSTVVTLLVLGAVAFSRGMEGAMSATGLATNALVLGSGSEESLERSEIPPATASVIAASIDGLALSAGRPVVSAENQAAFPVTVGDAAATLNAPPILVRGFENEAFLYAWK